MDRERLAAIEMEGEPESPRRPPWEALLGLALLVGVLGFAGIDWWQTEQAALAYRQGQAAATARHWDAAAGAFAQAGTYLDAPQHRAEAAAQAARRADLLAQAAQAASPGTAWHALTEAAAIEPDYPGLADQVEGARQTLFRQGVVGTVVLQAGGAQPGLYLLTEGGPSYLPGSDGQSRLRGRAPGGQAFLYDRALGVAPGACLVSCTPDRRQVVLARVGTAGPPGTQVVGGDLPADGSATFSGDGARWWWTAEGQTWYCDPAARQITDVLGTHPGWQLLALDPGQGRILLALPLDSGTDRTPLFLADAAGETVRPLAPAASGTILNATFSADGAYLVYLTQQPTTPIVRTLWRVDLRDPAQAQHELEWLPWGGIQTPVWLSAFLPPPPVGDTVLIYRLDGDGEAITGVNLRTGSRTSLWAGTGRQLHGNTTAISPDGRTLALHDPQGMAGRLVLAPVAGGEPVRTFPAPAYSGQSIHAAFSPRGDYVIYAVHNPDGLERGYTQPIYTLPITAPTGTAPLLLARDAVLPYDHTLATMAVAPGGDLLLYVRAGGSLQAVTFDGAAHVTLGSGVDAVWSLRDPAPWAWVR